MGFSRQEYWSGLPFPSPGIFLTQGLNLGLLHCRQMLYHLNHQGSQVQKNLKKKKEEEELSKREGLRTLSKAGSGLLPEATGLPTYSLNSP